MNRVHLKIENSNAREFKKELLLVELGFLNSIKKLRDFRKIRKLEFSTKSAVKRGFREINSELNKLSEIMPPIEKTKIVREILHERIEKPKPKITQEKTKETRERKSRRKDHLEIQLEEIKEKLAGLE